VYGGNRQYLPLRVNQAGVMPIIFASSLLLFPAVFFDWLGRLYTASGSSEWRRRSPAARPSCTTSFTFVLIYFFLLFLDCRHIQSQDMADNLKGWGSFIPGYRLVGPPRYLEKVMARITYVGAAFLAVVAIAPTIVSASATIDPTLASFYGGTSLLIAVSVAVDLASKSIDSPPGDEAKTIRRLTRVAGGRPPPFGGPRGP
jgi:preprotein translocase subunit SecY